MRRLVLLSTIAFLLCVLGCVGTFEPLPPDGVDAGATGSGGAGGAPSGGGGGSGGGTGAMPDAGTPGGAPDASGGTACIAAVTSGGSGRHNAGQDCVSCHNGSAAPRFSLGGTLFDGVGAAIAGATVEIVQGNGQTIRLATCDNGNFYTSQALTYPLRVRASRCPSDAPMVSMVQQGQSGCNSCHATAMRIHLP